MEFCIILLQAKIRNLIASTTFQQLFTNFTEHFMLNMQLIMKIMLNKASIDWLSLHYFDDFQISFHNLRKIFRKLCSHICAEFNVCNTMHILLSNLGEECCTLPTCVNIPLNQHNAYFVVLLTSLVLCSHPQVMKGLHIARYLSREVTHSRKELR